MCRWEGDEDGDTEEEDDEALIGLSVQMAVKLSSSAASEALHSIISLVWVEERSVSIRDLSCEVQGPHRYCSAATTSSLFETLAKMQTRPVVIVMRSSDRSSA